MGDKRIKIKIICGEIKGEKGPVQDIITDPEYVDIKISPHSEFLHSVKKDHNVFAYTIEGEGYFDDQKEEMISEETLVIFREGGDAVKISTSDKMIRFLLISGKPLREPVAWRGPIVMNTDEELQFAFEEYRKGTFIKHK